MICLVPLALVARSELFALPSSRLLCSASTREHSDCLWLGTVLPAPTIVSTPLYRTVPTVPPSLPHRTSGPLNATKRLRHGRQRASPQPYLRPLPPPGTPRPVPPARPNSRGICSLPSRPPTIPALAGACGCMQAACAGPCRERACEGARAGRTGEGVGRLARAQGESWAGGALGVGADRGWRSWAGDLLAPAGRWARAGAAAACRQAGSPAEPGLGNGLAVGRAGANRLQAGWRPDLLPRLSRFAANTADRVLSK